MLIHENELNYVFIGGFPGSGTTLLRVMLGSHPMVHCERETRILPWFLGQIQRKYYTKITHEGKEEALDSDSITRVYSKRLMNAGIPESLMQQAVKSFLDTIIQGQGERRIMKQQQQQQQSSQFLCSKDPFIMNHMREIVEIYGGGRERGGETRKSRARFIHIIRDGRAVVSSLQRRKVTIKDVNTTDYGQMFDTWRRFTMRSYRKCEHFGKDVCISLRYERLILHTEEILRKLTKFLGISFDRQMMHHEGLVGEGRHDRVPVSQTEKSTDDVKQAIYNNSLTNWLGRTADASATSSLTTLSNNSNEDIITTLQYFGYPVSPSQLESPEAYLKALEDGDLTDKSVISIASVAANYVMSVYHPQLETPLNEENQKEDDDDDDDEDEDDDDDGGGDKSKVKCGKLNQ
eukprot:CAMPEP_0185259558 /NCGR_PEP_ID=MMETSP1359-20130426/8315_1 /TAXON_ID=552665 /ORGANISM="Bigelowiella longifila, Strain CCMP242" /LENGTH=404 /DNA_ID=CAMNT_0027845503 /DNA_START=321 /DNA_END=1536 /DNA_ORIENTATION=-